MGQGSQRLALLVAVAVSLAAGSAAAFCRTTTCDGDPRATCHVDAEGCATDGVPLYWPTRCLSFGVQQDGSSKRHISYDTFDAIVQIAFRQWLAVDCGGRKHPSFSMWDMGDDYGPIVCSQPEYNRTAPNASVWMLRDSDWPHPSPGSTLALTTLTFQAATGHILDADVEINSFGVSLTTSDDAIEVDLQSIVTHEAGHFLGLSHSIDQTATMYGSYDASNRSARSLASDDAAGICAAYPPDRAAPSCEGPEPSHGFSRYCGGGVGAAGCAVVRAPSAQPRPGLLVALGLVWASLRVCRARARPI